MNLEGILGPGPRSDLDDMIAAGYVRTQTHPSEPYTIFNYTEKAQYERVWNRVTMNCRGLIGNHETGEVVARPWPKFFNWGEVNECRTSDVSSRICGRGTKCCIVDHVDVDPGSAVEVTDKMDGSLGILYPLTDGTYAIATRGSFTSDQAVHATEVWRSRYAMNWTPSRGITHLFEIIYPGNRIVVDYRDLDDLVWLGAVENTSGLDASPAMWPGPRAEVFDAETLTAALAMEPRPNVEGIVVRFVETGLRVKLKQDDYVRLHRLVFGVTARSLWENLVVHDLAKEGMSVKQIGQAAMVDVGEVQTILDAGPGWADDLLAVVPEEFQSWITDKLVELGTAHEYWLDAAQDEFDRFMRGLYSPTVPPSRKDFALAIKETDPGFHGALFSLLDGKSIRSYGWRAVRPEPERFKALSEDTA